MKRNNILYIIGALALFIILYNSFNAGESQKAYIQRIEEYRAEKDNDMRTGEDSPFGKDFDNYKGLNYYAPNQDYYIKARLNQIENKKIVSLPTSDGKTKQYLEYAHAIFELGGKENTLLILEMTGGQYDGHLFLAFGDATSAIETYGAGRYIELEKEGDNSIIIDFNLAYNPYCAYSDGYSCPFPPTDNLLEIPIEAGEKNYDN